MIARVMSGVSFRKAEKWDMSGFFESQEGSDIAVTKRLFHDSNGRMIVVYDGEEPVALVGVAQNVLWLSFKQGFRPIRMRALRKAWPRVARALGPLNWFTLADPRFVRFAQFFGLRRVRERSFLMFHGYVPMMMDLSKAT